MKTLMKSKVFIGAFLAVYFVFFAVTLSFAGKEKIFIAGYTEYGFPFVYYTTTCFSAFYSYSGLLGNILFAAILSFVGGLSAAHFWREVSSAEFAEKFAAFRVKWYL